MSIKVGVFFFFLSLALICRTLAIRTNLNFTDKLTYSLFSSRNLIFLVSFPFHLCNVGAFDMLFSWLGTESVIGAKSGSVWEYYFRACTISSTTTFICVLPLPVLHVDCLIYLTLMQTHYLSTYIHAHTHTGTSLDHWSSYMGMIFALNYPLVDQYFQKASRGSTGRASLYICACILSILTLYWIYFIYTLPKIEYNLHHRYVLLCQCLLLPVFFVNQLPSSKDYFLYTDFIHTNNNIFLTSHHRHCSGKTGIFFFFWYLCCV